MLPDFTLGLPAVEDWPQRTGDVPWILLSIPDQPHHLTTSPRRRRKKKHHRPKKLELKVTTQGQGDDVPIWSHARSNLSWSLESQTEGDSGVSSYRKPRNDARSTA